MAVPERWMVSNPSADVDEEPDTDDASPTTLRFVDLMEKLRKNVQFRHLPEVTYQTNYPHETVRTIWTGITEHLLSNDPYAPSFVSPHFASFTGEGVSTTRSIFEEFSPTTVSPEEPLLQAVARATEEQKEQIWRVLGVAESVKIRRRVVNPEPQIVSSDWLEDALNVRANPTPISLEDWYDDEST